jgi:hypothetical protein
MKFDPTSPYGELYSTESVVGTLGRGAPAQEIEEEVPMRGAFTGVLVLACWLLQAAAGDAQSSTSVVLRGAAAVPQGEWVSGESFGSGYGAGIDVMTAFKPSVGAYLGWEQLSFEMAPESVGESARRASDTGLRMGVFGRLPYTLAGTTPFALAGAIVNMTALDVSPGTTPAGRGSIGLGYEVGAGLDAPIAPLLSVMTAVRYRSHSVEFASQERVGGEEWLRSMVSYFALGVGLRVRLP